jgi:aryl-alcohol dehydrogenase-like predicted oxidoreductase
MEAMMNYRKLGRTGLKVSPLCMGTMQFGWSVNEADTQRVLSAALEAGINFIDTADVYSRWVEGNPGGVSETFIGNWLKKTKIPICRQVMLLGIVFQSMKNTPKIFKASILNIFFLICRFKYPKSN